MNTSNIYANRWFAAYLLVFFTVWGATAGLADLLGLNTLYTVMAGIIAGAAIDKVQEYFVESRETTQTAESEQVS